MNANDQIALQAQEITSLKNELSCLKEKLAWFQKHMFGQRSEKMIRDLNDEQPLLPGFQEFYDPKDEDAKEPPPKPEGKKREKTKNKDAIKHPDNLPVEKILLDLLPEEKICPESGEPLVKIGEEISRKLVYKPGVFSIKEYIRPKYASKKCSENGIRTAPMPNSLFSRSPIDESILADVLTKRFSDHLPYYRIHEIYKRDNVFISRQLFSSWTVRTGKLLSPLVQEMMKQVLASQNLFVDETPVKLLVPGKGKAQQAYMWVYVGGSGQSPPYRIYDFCLNRQHDNVISVLKDYEGHLHSDKYGAYETLAKLEAIWWCPCWAHIRRKFIESLSGDTVFRDWVLLKIKHLYMYEKIAWKLSPEKRTEIREKHEAPIIDKLVHAIKKKLLNDPPLPKSKLHQALYYFSGLIPYLKNYHRNSYARLDNNHGERAIRSLTIGRKNWLFLGSEDGGEAAATILSLVQTCRGLSINVFEYFNDILRRLLDHPYKDIAELLPDQWIIKHPQFRMME